MRVLLKDFRNPDTKKKLHTDVDEQDYLITLVRYPAILFVRLFDALSWSPNQVSLLGGMLWLLSFVVIILDFGRVWNLIAFVLFLLSAIVDAADGPLARLKNQTSDKGFFLDTTLDFWRDTFLYLLAFYEGFVHTGEESIIMLYVLCLAMWFINQKSDFERRFFAFKRKTKTNLRDEIAGRQSLMFRILRVIMKLYNTIDTWGIQWITMLLLAFSRYVFIKYVFLYLLISKFVRNAFSVYATVKMLKA